MLKNSYESLRMSLRILRTCLDGMFPSGPLDLSTPTGMSCIGTYGENCKSDNVSKYRVLSVAFLL